MANDIHNELEKELQTIASKNLPIPHLALVRIGGDPASASYVKNKTRAAEKIGKRTHNDLFLH